MVERENSKIAGRFGEHITNGNGEKLIRICENNKSEQMDRAIVYLF